MSEFSDFARKFSDLYSETIEENECSPVYNELSEMTERYTRAQEIAKGGMKSIKRVFDVSTSRYLAMAELLPDIDETFNEVFLREARLTALLDHPNIISIHDIGLNSNGRPFFTMDLKNGDTLEDILRQLNAGNETYEKRFPLEVLLGIFTKICDAMAYAHSQNIIHQDLKPANIQVGVYGEVLVCDWGLGKILDNYDTQDLEELLLDKDLLNHMTFNGQIKGTPGFMAPEQIKKDAEKGSYTDIYALGAILYSMLTLHRPLDGEVDDILENTLKGNIIPPKELKTVDRGLSAVTMRAMSTEIVNRYPSVNKLKNEVQNYLSGYSTIAEKAGFVKEFSLFVKRNKTACLVAFSALIILFSISLLFINNLKAKTKALKAQQNELELKQKALEQKKNEAFEFKKDC